MSNSMIQTCWRLLVIEHDEQIAARLCDAIEQLHLPDCKQIEPADIHAAQLNKVSRKLKPEYKVISSLEELHNIELEQYDVVLCASYLPDAHSLDALAFIKGMAPDLPVIITGNDQQSSLAIESIRAGAVDYLVLNKVTLSMLALNITKCFAHRAVRVENRKLHENLSRSLSELAVANRQFQKVIERLERMSRTDELTGLANRRWLNLMLDDRWAEATRNDVPLACLMIDLDQFKRLNDDRGHHVGDAMLRTAGQVISANCRHVDIAARYGGDEFCILMPHTDPEEAMIVGDRILMAFQQMVEQLDEKECVVGMSMGLSHSALSLPVSAIELVRHADEAMYVAKSNGKLGGTKRVMVRYRHLESEMCVLPYTGSATVTNTNEPLSVKNNELRQAG